MSATHASLDQVKIVAQSLTGPHGPKMGEHQQIALSTTKLPVLGLCGSRSRASVVEHD